MSSLGTARSGSCDTKYRLAHARIHWGNFQCAVIRLGSQHGCYHSRNWTIGAERREHGVRTMPRHVYLQPDVPDPALAPDAVLALARRHVPTARAVISVDESGGEARTYAVSADGEDLVVKVQR